MSFAAVAIGVAGVASAAMSASAAGKAADAQADAADKSAQVQWDMYNQTREDQGPYRDVGTNALYRMADHYGLGYGTPTSPASSSYMAPVTQQAPVIQQAPTPARVSTGSSLVDMFMNAPTVNQNAFVRGMTGDQSFNRQPQSSTSRTAPTQQAYSAPAGPYSSGDRQQDAMGHFFTSPDYQFRLDEGIRGIENSMLSRGKGLSGNTAKAITGYAGDMASGEWNSYMNRLAALSGVGQTATNQMGTLGANMATNVGNANIAAGQARGSGYIGQGDAWGNAFSNVAGAAGYGNWGGNSPNYFNTATGSAYGTNPFSQQSMMLANQWG